MIDDIFVPQEVEAIKKIPLTHQTTTDSFFKLLAQDGNHCCKSGYHFLKRRHSLTIVWILIHMILDFGRIYGLYILRTR